MWARGGGGVGQNPRFLCEPPCPSFPTPMVCEDDKTKLFFSNRYNCNIWTVGFLILNLTAGTSKRVMGKVGLLIFKLLSCQITGLILLYDTLINDRLPSYFHVWLTV